MATGLLTYLNTCEEISFPAGERVGLERVRRRWEEKEALSRGLPVVRFVVISNLTNTYITLTFTKPCSKRFPQVDSFNEKAQKMCSLIHKTKYSYDILSYFIHKYFYLLSSLCCSDSLLGQKNMNLVM